MTLIEPYSEESSEKRHRKQAEILKNYRKDNEPKRKVRAVYECVMCAAEYVTPPVQCFKCGSYSIVYYEIQEGLRLTEGRPTG